MVGGVDVEIAHPKLPPTVVLAVATRCICRHWPQAIIDTDADEVFVYRDQEAFDSWERLGADGSNVNTMFHLIADETTLTVVVDDDQEPTVRSVLDEIRRQYAERT